MSKQPVFQKPHCPHCHVSLLGDAICLSMGDTDYYGTENYSRTLGVEISEVYDGVLYWQCPDCGGTWQRFDITEPLHRLALPYMRGSHV